MPASTAARPSAGLLPLDGGTGLAGVRPVQAHSQSEKAPTTTEGDSGRNRSCFYPRPTGSAHRHRLPRSGDIGSAVFEVVRKSVRAAHISRSVSTHTFRHSCATHMLRAGAPIRHLQEMLGHASIETTQVYTRVTITDLKAVHRRFHPREQDPEEGKE